MYYFKVPVFTKLSKKQNIIFSILQISILITSISVSIYRGCSYESIYFENGCKTFKILPGNTLITDKTSGIWQFVTQRSYSSELLPKISTMEYFNIYNTTYNGHVLMKGNIVIYDYKINNYVSLFKEFLLPLYYNEFSNYFMEKVDMNNEIYDVAIKDGFLEFSFLNNCSNNLNLIEHKGCRFTNNTLENINDFLLNYFNETFVVPYTCNDCYKNGINSVDELISVSSKCISLFIFFNSILILIYIFILSKITNTDIGYFEDIIYKDNHEIKNNKDILY